MLVTFPHLGNLTLALGGVFRQLGAEVITPPLTNKTMDLGVLHAPKNACLPFKLVLGNFIEALDAGVETILMLGGSGPCRFGYFGSLAQVILEDLGYQFKMVILEGEDMLDQLTLLRKELGVSSWAMLDAMLLGWYKLLALDRWESRLNRDRYRAINAIQMERLYNDGLELIRQASDVKNLRKTEETILKSLNRYLATGNTSNQPKKIALVGDIYMQVEGFANHDVATLLGELGFEVHRSIYLSSWIINNFWPFAKGKEKHRLLRDAKPYLGYEVGGHGLDTVANTVDFWTRGFHGVIQLMPMTCMPEIVAHSVLPKVAAVEGVPVLSLVLDEHGAKEGLHTRVEAFAETICQRP